MMRGEWQGNIYQNLADRSATHSTPEKFANLDIDELRTLADMAQDGGSHGVTLTDEQRTVINDQITAVEKDEILRTKVAKRDRDQYIRLRDGASPQPSSGADGSMPADGAMTIPHGSAEAPTSPPPDENRRDNGVSGHGDFMDHLK